MVGEGRRRHSVGHLDINCPICLANVGLGQSGKATPDP